MNTTRPFSKPQTSGLMTPGILLAKMTSPRYTHEQKKAMLFHAGNVAEEAGDDDLYDAVLDLFHGLTMGHYTSPSPN